MPKFFLIAASISGLFAVGLGAFGAHALRAKLEASNLLNAYQTGVQYHFYHTLALLAVGILCLKYENAYLNYSGYAFLFGLLLFSGSLYAMSFTGMRWLGAITPIGGVLFMLGWGMLALAVPQILK